MSATALLLGHHAFFFVCFTYTIYAGFNMDIPILRDRFSKFDPGQFKYLTMWDVILQAVFFFVCLLNDIFGSNSISPKKRPFMRRFKDFFHASLGFPVAMFVGITFWGLMFVDRELVLPKALDPYFPWWLNHLMHTMIMFGTLIEMVVAPRQYPKRKNGAACLAVFMLSYLVWMHVIYMKSGIWVYPVLDVLQLPMRIVFFVSLLAVVGLLYFAGEALDHLIWGNHVKSSSKRNRKEK